MAAAAIAGTRRQDFQPVGDIGPSSFSKEPTAPRDAGPDDPADLFDYSASGRGKEARTARSTEEGPSG